MCNFFSAIATSKGEVFFCEDDSHETIFDRAGLKDNGSIIRLECTDGKTVKVDSDSMPEWYERRSCVIVQRVRWLYVRVATAGKAYDEAVVPAHKAYYEAVATARKAYDEAVATAGKAYYEAVSPARKAYDEAVATAGKAYYEAVVPAHKAYDEAVATARKAYYEAVATARKAWIARLKIYKGYVGDEGA